MGLQILSVYWGEKHADLFEKGCLESLTRPKNLESLRDATWNIFTDDIYFDRLRGRIPSTINVQLRSTTDLLARIDRHHEALCWQIKQCLASGDRMLLAPPDTIFGDGSIGGLLKIGWEKGSCVVSPHPRVLPSILGKYYLSNAELVSVAWKHLHKSWSDAETGHARQNSFIGGVAWESLGDGLISVCHRLPTVYLADFTKEDLRYFETRTSFGDYDHTWPSDCLINQGRMRYVGSSDACFIVEITDEDKNIPPVALQGDPAKFWRNNLHNNINSQMRAIFRMEA